MIKPRALRSGDRVAVVAPASPFPAEDFEAGLAEVERLGFEPVYEPSVFDRRGYEAGSAESRADAIARALADDSIAAVMAVRGGYGSVHVLPLLDAAEVRRARKAFVGYSDLTSLLTFLTIHAGITCFHGPSVAGCLGLGQPAYDGPSLVRAITCTEPMGRIEGEGLETVKAGEANGVLLGGTLTQLVASLGTPFAFAPPSGHVLLLDEVGERPYRIDRMLTQLALSGVLRRAAAIVFNGMPGCDEPVGQPTARATIADVLRDFPGPVVAGLRTGHSRGPMLTVPLGVRARVVAGPSAELVIEEAAVQ